MDLTRIDALTRHVLDAEAEKRGIKHPERRSRRELLRLILEHDYDAARRVRDASQLVGAVLQTAMAALPLIPNGMLDRLRARLSPPAPVAEAPRPVQARAVERAVPPSAATRVEPAPTPPLTAATDQPAPAASSVRDSGAPSTRSFVEEPIRTHSMARLLTTQGHRERALLIYEELVAKNSADAALAREAAALRDGQPLTFSPGELPQPHAATSATNAAFFESSDRIACEARGDGALSVRWSISAAGVERARTLLGAHGELAVRLVNIRPDPARVVRSEITEHGPVASEGEWATSLGVSSTRSFAAVGLRDAERFVSIVHTRAE